jgi:hypothetical protein
MTLTDFDRWVGQNNIPETFAYSKGWWDYVELVRPFSTKFDLSEARVAGHYIVHTPPPEEKLPMPAVVLNGNGIMVALKWDFGAVPRRAREWIVSVRRRSPYRGPTFGLFDPTLDLRRGKVEGLGEGLVFGPYRENAAEFTCEVEDEWDVATLLRFVCNEA